MAKNIHPKKTWRYNKEFKLKAVKLSYQYGVKVIEVAKALGIHESMHSRWRSEYRDGKIHGDNKKRECINAT